MTAFTARIETSIAVVERDDQGLIQVRIRPATTLTIVAIAEVLEARRRLSEGQPRLGDAQTSNCTNAPHRHRLAKIFFVLFQP